MNMRIILPAHRKNNPHIDLYSAITAQALCEVAHYIKLPDVLQKKINKTVKRRIKIPYETKELKWEQWKNNWQAVCAGCVGMVYLYEFPESFASVKERILKSLNTYIDNFEDDGVCMEGIVYNNGARRLDNKINTYFAFTPKHLELEFDYFNNKVKIEYRNMI